MLTFIAAVVFWPITLLYFFCIYIVPFLFKALIVICSCIIYFATQNPGISISLGVLAFIYLAISESKTNGNKEAHKESNEESHEESHEDAIFIKFKSESILSFESIWQLDDESLQILLSKLLPETLGLALCLVEIDKQRRALKLISRDMAIKAFEILQKDQTMNRSGCLESQIKILDLAIFLQYSRVIHFHEKSQTKEKSEFNNESKGGDEKFKNPLTKYHKVFDYRKGDRITRVELKKRYFSLLKKHHPDMWATGSMKEKIKSEKKTKKINLAYEYLSTLSD
jgi:hypothetical protein